MKENLTNEEYYRKDMNDAIRHGMCVSYMATQLAKEISEDEEFIRKVGVAAMLHDIGKLQITPYIYGRKEDTMKIEEMQYVRLHAKFGAKILEDMEYDSDITEMVLYHHENYDGSGYPFRLMGNDIPVGSRIIRVCDVFSALISDRPYRKAFDPETAFTMVIDEVRHFDMHIFLAFQRLFNTTDLVERVMDILHGDIAGLDE